MSFCRQKKKAQIAKQPRHHYTGEQMKELVFPHLPLAMEVTGKFEGQGWDQVTGNFDGQGLSLGILQWCVGQGSFQRKLLRPYIRQYGPVSYMPGPIQHLLTLSNSEGVRWVKQNVLNGTRVKGVWDIALRKWLSSPQMREIQTEAAKDIAARAQHYCIEWDLHSPRAFCFFFDVVTQGGSMETVTKEVADATSSREIETFLHETHYGLFQKYAQHSSAVLNARYWFDQIGFPTLDYEQTLLLKAAYQRARTSTSKWQQLVLNRKGAIAVGSGYCYGTKYNFESKFNATALPVTSA